MLGLRRSGKRRKNRNQPRHPSDLHRKERDLKHVDRALDAGKEDSFPVSERPVLTIPGNRQKDAEDVERPGNPNRGENHNR